jgi:Carboxypeptidase regulatory-like domain
MNPQSCRFILGTLALSLLAAPADFAAVVSIHVRGAAAAPYVGLVPEASPWREPLREAVLGNQQRTIRWTVPAGRYRVVAGAPGAAIWFGDAVEPSDAAPANVTADLVALRPASGRIVAADGSPIGRARVGLIRAFVLDSSRALSAMGESHLRQTMLAESDAKGEFVFPLHPAASHLLYVEADGFAPALLTGITAEASKQLRGIVLHPGARLQLTLTGNRSSSTHYDRLRLIPDEVALPTGVNRDLALALWTRSVGQTPEWSSLPPGRYRLTYDTARMTSDVVPHVIGSVELREGESRALPVASPPQRVAGAPGATTARLFIPNATLKELAPMVVKRWNSTTEETARFEAEETSGGVQLAVQGCSSAWRHLVLTRDRMGAAPTTDGCRARVELKPKASATAKLVAPAGSAVPQRGIVRLRSCRRQDGDAGEYPVSVRSDGRAEMLLPAGCTVPTLFFDSFVPVTFERANVTAGSAHELPLVRLQPGGAILVRLVSADGDPIDDATIEAALRREVESAEARSADEVPRIASARTRGGGWARLTGIPREDVVLLMHRPQQRNPGISEAYRVDAGQQLLIDPLPFVRPASLVVTIEGADRARGAQVELVDVALTSTGGSRWPRQWTVRATPAGDRVVLDDVPPGNWRMVVHGRLPGGLATAVGMAPVSIVAGRDAEMSVPITRVPRKGRVLHRGEPVAGSLTLRPAKGAQVTAATDRDGRFLALLEPGRYTVSFAQQPQQGPLRWISFPGYTIDDGAEDIEIDLPAARIRGRVVGVAGEGIAGAVVRAMSLDVSDGAIRHAELEASTDASGAFVLEAVTEGEWTIEASRARERSDATSVTVARDTEMGGVVLRLSGVEAVSGQLVDFRGQPLARASVVVQALAAGVPRIDTADTGPRGEFSIAFIPPRSADLPTSRSGLPRARQRRSGRRLPIRSS